MRNAVAVMLSLAALAALAQKPWTPATEGWTTGKIAQAEARASSNAAAQVAAVLTNGLFSGATLAGDTVLTGGVTRAYGGLEAVVESGLAVYGASPDTHGVRGSSGTGGYGVYGTTYAGWAGVAGFGTLAPGIYGSGGVGYPGGWFVGDTGASPAGVATGLIAEAGLDRTQPGLYTPNSVHAYAFYGSGGALTGITERALSAGPSNVIVSALTVTGRQDIVAGAMFTTPGYAGAAGGVDGWALYPDSYQGLSQGASWTLGAGALEWRDENKQARADTWGLWMHDIASDLYLSLSGDMLKARDGYRYSHWTGFHRRKSTGTSVYTNAALEDVIVAMHEHEAAEDPHAGKYLSPSQLAPYMTGEQTSNLVQSVGQSWIEVYIGALRANITGAPAVVGQLEGTAYGVVGYSNAASTCAFGLISLRPMEESKTNLVLCVCSSSGLSLDNQATYSRFVYVAWTNKDATVYDSYSTFTNGVSTATLRIPVYRSVSINHSQLASQPQDTARDRTVFNVRYRWE